MNLFAYGTLMWPEVLESVIGRRPAAAQAVLKGYTRLRVKGQHYPAVIPAPGDVVLYRDLTAAEFRHLDRFEGEEYDRTAVETNGTPAFVYVLSNHWKHLADSRPWKPDDLKPEHLARFCSEYKGWNIPEPE